MKIIAIIFTILFSQSLLNASVPKLHLDPVKPAIQFAANDDYVLITFQRLDDLTYKRKIEVVDVKGKRIFKSKAGTREMVSELNMAQLKIGQYVIRVHLEDGIQEYRYVKR